MRTVGEQNLLAPRILPDEADRIHDFTQRLASGWWSGEQYRLMVFTGLTDVDLQVQVRSGGLAGHAHHPDHLTGFYVFTGFDRNDSGNEVCDHWFMFW